MPTDSSEEGPGTSVRHPGPAPWNDDRRPPYGGRRIAREAAVRRSGGGGLNLTLVSDPGQPVQAPGQPPVVLAEELHGGRQKHAADERRVEQDGEGQADAQLLEQDELER